MTKFELIERRGEFCGHFTEIGLTPDGLPDFHGAPEDRATTSELLDLQDQKLAGEADLARLRAAVRSVELDDRASEAMRRPGFWNGPKLTAASLTVTNEAGIRAQQRVSDYAHVDGARYMAKTYIAPEALADVYALLGSVVTRTNTPGSFYMGIAAWSQTGSFNGIPIVTGPDGGLEAVVTLRARDVHLPFQIGMFGGMAEPEDIVNGMWTMSYTDLRGNMLGTGHREFVQELNRPVGRLLSAHMGNQPDNQNTVIGIEYGPGWTRSDITEGMRASSEGMAEHSDLAFVPLQDVPALAASPWQMAPWVGSSLTLLAHTIEHAPELAEYRTGAHARIGEVSGSGDGANTYWQSVRNSPSVRQLAQQFRRVPVLPGLSL